jgi:preprotein translocase subunit SecA
LTEWQHEGFSMFQEMMASVEDDFVQFVMKLEIVTDEAAARQQQRLQYFAPDNPVQGSSSFAAIQQDPAIAAAAQGISPQVSETMAMQPVHVEKTPGRNDPCFCGSGKKYKLCHGK